MQDQIPNNTLGIALLVLLLHVSEDIHNYFKGKVQYVSLLYDVCLSQPSSFQ